MYCNYCRALNPNDSVYCSACGRAIGTPVKSKNEEPKVNNVAVKDSAPPLNPQPGAASPPIAKSFENKVGSASSETSIPTKPQDEELTSWQYKEMSDEELGKLNQPYQKLRTPMPQPLQTELITRSRKQRVSDKKPALGPAAPHERTASQSASQSNEIINPSQLPLHSEDAKSKPTTNAAAAYGWFIFSLLCFTVCAGSIIFQLVLAAANGSPDAFPQWGPFFVGLIATAIGAKKSWSRMLLAEPEIEPIFRRKHRLFGLTTATVVVVAFLAAGVYGNYLGLRSSRLKSVLAQMSALGPKTAPVKQRFIQLARKDPPTVPEYLQRCEDLAWIIHDFTGEKRKDALKGVMNTRVLANPAFPFGASQK